ncbi:hypothetical protein EU527_09235 [Candidatus Thorarchaeota archaeon]|nr:MAG: hypothetical protein EU527_09235 [Candidatus Thorarchaeota archaeon]
MIPGIAPSEDIEADLRIKPTYIALLAILIVFSGIILAWLGGQGIIPVEPGMVLGITILTATVIVCCASLIMLGSVASKIPEYAEMELRFEEGLAHYENERWENALLIFTELSGSKMDHKRALFYAALCYNKLDDQENVKRYSRAYLKLRPDDREVWELLASAHKKLFEYEEAEIALQKASNLPES